MKLNSISARENGPLVAWGLGLVAVFHTFLAVFLGLHHRLIPDEDAYIGLARNLAEKHSFHLDFGAFLHAAGDPQTYYAPAWPFLLSLGYWMGKNAGMWAVQALVWLFAGLAGVLLCRLLGARKRVQLAAAGLFAISPMLAYYHGHLMTETLAILLTLAIAGVGTRFLREPNVHMALALGLLSGFGHLTRTMLIVIPLCYLGMFLFRAGGLRSKALLLTVFGLAHVSVVAPWLVRMHSVEGGFTNTELKAGITLFVYNNPSVANPYALTESDHFAFPAGVEALKPAERDRVLTRTALAAIVSHPHRYLLLCARRVAYLLSPVALFSQRSLSDQLLLAVSTLCFVYLPWAAILWLTIKRRVVPTQAEVASMLVILIWYLVHILIHGSVRQRLPSDALLIHVAVVLCGRAWALRSVRPVAVHEEREFHVNRLG